MRTHEEPEDEQHEEACLNNLPNHGDDDEVAPGRDFEGSVFVDFLLFDPVLGRCSRFRLRGLRHARSHYR